MGEKGGSRSLHDIYAGAIFIAFGVGFAVTAALNYDLGTVRAMGPGYMPLLLGGILAVLGAAIVFVGLGKREMVRPSPIPWRGLAFILSSIALFGFAISGLGLGPTVASCTVLTAIASRSNKPLFAVVLGVVLAALCVALFRYVLGIPLSPFGPWVGGY